MARQRSDRQKKIQNVHWTYGSFSTLVVVAGTPVAVEVFSAQHLTETLMRTRGEFLTWLDGAPTPGDAVAFGMGLIVVPEGTGTTVLWSPLTDGDAPWLWVDYSSLAYDEPVTDVIDIPLATAVRRIIDSKAMRIIRNSEVQFVIEQSTIGSAQAINCIGQVRSLFGS